MVPKSRQKYSIVLLLFLIVLVCLCGSIDINTLANDSTEEKVVAETVVAERCPLVKSSFLVNWDETSFDKLITMCEDGGTIELDADFDYIISKTIQPDKSLCINGKNHTLRTRNKEQNYVIDLLHVKNQKSIELRNITIDGSWDKGKANGRKTNTFFMMIEDVESVVIDSCKFNNICTDFSNWKPGMDVQLIMIKGYKTASITNNIITNVERQKV